MQFGESPTFWTNTLPLSSGLKGKQSKKPAESGSLLFNPGNGADVFLRNVRLSLNYMAL
jgi:hypothetical protein